MGVSIDPDALYGLSSRFLGEETVDFRKKLIEAKYSQENDNGEENKNIVVFDKKVGVSSVDELSDSVLFDQYLKEIWTRREESEFLNSQKYMCLRVESLGFFKSNDEEKRTETFSEVAKKYIEERDLDVSADVVLMIDSVFSNTTKKGGVETRTSFFILTRDSFNKLWNRTSNKPEELLDFLQENGIDVNADNFLTGIAVRMIDYGEKITREESRPFVTDRRKVLYEQSLLDEVIDNGEVENINIQNLPLKESDPSRYDEMFEDLYLVSVSEDENTVNMAKQRLNEHRIRLKKHYREQDENNYVS